MAEILTQPDSVQLPANFSPPSGLRLKFHCIMATTWIKILTVMMNYAEKPVISRPDPESELAFTQIGNVILKPNPKREEELKKSLEAIFKPNPERELAFATAMNKYWTMALAGEFGERVIDKMKKVGIAADQLKLTPRNREVLEAVGKIKVKHPAPAL